MFKPNPRRLPVHLWKDHQGQTTVEYILLMLVVIAAFGVLNAQFLQPMITLLSQGAKNMLMNSLFTGSLHYFPVRR